MNDEFLDYVEDIIDAMEKAEMAGMRNRIIHGYDNVNLQIVWDTVKQRIPNVKLELQQILADYNVNTTFSPPSNKDS